MRDILFIRNSDVIEDQGQVLRITPLKEISWCHNEDKFFCIFGIDDNKEKLMMRSWLEHEEMARFLNCGWSVLIGGFNQIWAKHSCCWFEFNAASFCSSYFPSSLKRLEVWDIWRWNMNYEAQFQERLVYLRKFVGLSDLQVIYCKAFLVKIIFGGSFSEAWNFLPSNDWQLFVQISHLSKTIFFPLTTSTTTHTHNAAMLVPLNSLIFLSYHAI